MKQNVIKVLFWLFIFVCSDKKQEWNMEGDLDKSLLRDVQTSVFRIAGGYLQHSPPVYCIFIRSHILTFQWIVPGSMGWTEKNSISTNPSFLHGKWRHLPGVRQPTISTLKQEMKMLKITHFFVPKIISFFASHQRSPASFICSFILRAQVDLLFSVTFIQKGFCVMTFVREKRQRKSSGCL